HRANERGAVRQKIVVAEEKRHFPRIIERRLDRVYHVRTTLADAAARLQDLRPFGRAAARELRKWVRFGGPYDASELAVFDPRRVQQVHAADRVRENDARAVAIEALINERLVRLFAFRPSQRGARYHH